MIYSLADIPGLSITVSGNVNPVPDLRFGGVYHAGSLQGFDTWIFTFTMPRNFAGAPNLVLSLVKS